MEIKIISDKNNDTNLNRTILKTVNVLNGVQNYFHYQFVISEDDICETEKFDWFFFSDNVIDRDNDEKRIYLTQKPFSDNWFSHESSNVSVVSTNDWENFFAPPSLKSYIAYQIAQSSITFVAGLSENLIMRMVHKKPRGCMFDICYNKSEIKLGMVAGVICPHCQATLRGFGIQMNVINAVERILQYVRSEAIGNPINLKENQAFIVMRFSTNDENHNAYLYGVRTALQELGINCVRADDRLVSAPIFQNVKNGIKESRFIIVKVDSNNLNVYFELGLAMGWNKDVLLISNEEDVINLPTDLNNWTCLTYPNGNYEALKNNVMQYFRDNYYYQL